MFENAYFGKPYKTRNGRKALYITKSSISVFVYVENSGLSCYNAEGLHRRYADLDDFESQKAYTELDIISEWKEEIDEEKLHEISLNEAKKYANSEAHCISYIDFISGYESGYRKAKEL